MYSFNNLSFPLKLTAGGITQPYSHSLYHGGRGVGVGVVGAGHKALFITLAPSTHVYLFYSQSEKRNSEGSRVTAFDV